MPTSKDKEELLYYPVVAKWTIAPRVGCVAKNNVKTLVCAIHLADSAIESHKITTPQCPLYPLRRT
jgi:hypothetical protein